MANQIVINIGALPNDGTGDPLRTAFNDVNLNFANIWATGVANSNITFSGNKILTTNTNGNLVLAPNGLGVVQSNVSIVPNINRVHNLGSSTKKWDTLYVWYGEIDSANIASANITGGTLTIDVGNLHIAGGSNGYVLQTDGTGNLTWTAQTGGTGNGTPGGANTQVQFNDAGAFGGHPNFTFNKDTDTLEVPANLIVNNIYSVDSTTVHVIDDLETLGDFSAVGMYLSTGGGSLINQPGNVVNLNSLANLQLEADGSAWLFDTTGNLTTPGDILPVGNNTQSLGSATQQWKDIWLSNSTIYINSVPLSLTSGNVLTVDGNPVITVTTGNIANVGNFVFNNNALENSYGGSFDNGSLVNGWTARLSLPANGGTNPALFQNTYGNIAIGAGDTAVITAGWTFDNTGNITLPSNTAHINYANGTSILDGVIATGNISSINLDGNVSNVLAGDGTWIAAGGNYGDSNVTTLLGAFGSNTVSTTGNITSGYFIGDGSQLTNLPVQPGTYGDSNVTSLLGAFGSNTISTSGNVTAGYVIGDGSQLTNLPVQPGTYSDSNVTSLLGTFGSNTISTSGNVTAGYVIGDGSQLTNLPIQPGTYGDSNVTSLLGTFGSNTISTSGNVTAGYVIGDGSQLTNLPVQPGTYGDSNVTSLMSTFGSNTISTSGNVTAGYVIGDGSQLTNLPVQPGTYGDSNVTSLLANFGSNVISTTGNIDGGNVNTGVIHATTVTNLSGTLTLQTGSTYDLVLNPSANISASSNWINNLKDPAQAQDAATKKYVDDNSAGLNVHDPVLLASTQDLATYTGATVAYDNGTSGVGATLSLTGNTLTTLDGTSITGGSSTRLLIKDEANAVLNGVYTYTSNTLLTRATDMDSAAELGGGDYVFVQSGATQASSSWVQQGAVGNVGVGNVNFVQFSASQSYSAGNALILNGSQFNVRVDNSTIDINGSNQLEISPTATISTSGNITGGNILSPGIISSAGNTYQSNVIATGYVTATGNITGDYIIGNGALLTGLPASYGDSNVVTLLTNYGSNTISGTGNITTTGNISGTYILGNAAYMTGIPAGYTDSNVTTLLAAYGSNTISGTGNITTTANISGGNLKTTGLISASGTITGSSLLGTVVSASANITGGNLLTGGLISATGTITGSSLLGTVASLSGNVTGGNLLTGGLISATGNITSSGNISGGNIIGTFVSPGANTQVIFNDAGVENATAGFTFNKTTNAVATTGTVSATANITGGNLLTGGLISATSTITTASNLAVNGGVISTTAATGNVFNTTPTTVNIGAGASTAVNIGNASGVVSLSGNVQGSTNGFAIGYRDIPQVTFSGNATITLSDAGKHYYSTSASNLTLTIANSATTNFAIGTAINLINQGTGTITIAQAGGVTMYFAGNSTSGNRTLSSYGMATVQKVATDTWFIVGVGVT